MRKRFLLALTLILSAIISLGAQEYVPTPVTISKDKVKLDGKVYYSHVVLERQTLYGISKAYNVSIEELFSANESIGLRENGLKKNSIILIPVKTDKVQDKKTSRRRDSEDETAAKQEEAAMAPSNGTEKTEPAPAEPANDVKKMSEDETGFIDGLGPVDDPAASDTTAVEEIPEPKSDVNIIMMLPLKAATGRGSSGYMDFYSGALAAARAKGIQGINVNLSIYDVANGLPSIDEKVYRKADVIIGPVFYDNMKALLDEVPVTTAVVSPMDARTEALAGNHRNLIQAHGSNDMQYADLIKWLARDYSEGEKIVLIYEKGKDKDIAKVEKLLAENGLSHSKVSYNILEGRSIDVTLKARMEPGRINRAVIVSESEAFVNDAIRNLSVLNIENSGSYKVALYGPSKIKTFETIEAENLHNTNLHLAMSYNVNYEDARVKDFLLKYRAIFKTEPTAFAYQGYDLTYFFISMVAKYGDKWMRWFTNDSSSMLQTDFKFEKISDDKDSGYINSALRHVVYDSDYSVDIVK